jgi:hypothetical protein
VEINTAKAHNIPTVAGLGKVIRHQIFFWMATQLVGCVRSHILCLRPQEMDSVKPEINGDTHDFPACHQ